MGILLWVRGALENKFAKRAMSGIFSGWKNRRLSLI